MRLLWESSAFWGIVGLVGGAIITVTVTIITKNRKTLTYSTICTPLLRWFNTSGYTIALNGEPIESLYSLRIKFTNTGNQTINGSDFANAMPLSIKASRRLFPTKFDGEYTLHSYTFGHNHTPQLLVIDERTIEIAFEFLKPQESFAVSALCDGEISVSGELKSGEIKPDLSPTRAIGTVMCVILVTACIFGLFFFIFGT